MSEPFFDYIRNNRNTISNTMYGFDDSEKRYQGLEYQALPEVEMPKATLVEALVKRKSTRNFSKDAMSIVHLSTILELSLRKKTSNAGSIHYSFPSGGGFYPIETYLLIHSVSGLEPGLYHYASVTHSIVKIAKMSKRLENISKDTLPQSEVMAGVYVFMTMVKSRCIQKYGSLVYFLSLVEAGHRGQNICLSSAICEIGCCAFGFNEYERMNLALDVDGANEHYIYGLALGIPAKE